MVSNPVAEVSRYILKKFKLGQDMSRQKVTFGDFILKY